MNTLIATTTPTITTTIKEGKEGLKVKEKIDYIAEAAGEMGQEQKNKKKKKKKQNKAKK